MTEIILAEVVDCSPPSFVADDDDGCCRGRRCSLFRSGDDMDRKFVLHFVPDLSKNENTDTSVRFYSTGSG